MVVEMGAGSETLGARTSARSLAINQHGFTKRDELTKELWYSVWERLD